MGAWQILGVYQNDKGHTWRTVVAVRGEGRARQTIRAQVHVSNVDEFDPAAYWAAQ